MAFADNNYQQNKALYDILAQVFDTYKYGAVSSGHTWNKPVQELSGVTMRFLGESNFELTYHRYAVDTIEGVQRMKVEDPGEKFLKEVSKQIAKEFKSATGKAITLKKVKENPMDFEKVSRLTGETSYLLGASRYGHGSRPVGRYLVRSSCVYDFNSKL